MHGYNQTALSRLRLASRSKRAITTPQAAFSARVLRVVTSAPLTHRGSYVLASFGCAEGGYPRDREGVRPNSRLRGRACVSLATMIALSVIALAACRPGPAE